MKKTILTLAILLQLNQLFSQKNTFLSFSVGLSNPVGDYKSTEPTNNKASAAKTGLSLDLNGGLKFNNNIGAQILIRKQSNSLDKATIEQAFPVGTFYEVKSWNITSLLIGPYLSFKLSEKIDLEPRVLIGYTSISSPEISANYSGISFFQESKSGEGFGYLIGSGIKFNISEKWFISGNIDYNAATADINNIKISNSLGNFDFTNISTSFSAINTNIGVGLKF